MSLGRIDAKDGLASVALHEARSCTLLKNCRALGLARCCWGMSLLDNLPIVQQCAGGVRGSGGGRVFGLGCGAR